MAQAARVCAGGARHAWPQHGRRRGALQRDRRRPASHAPVSTSRATRDGARRRAGRTRRPDDAARAVDRRHSRLARRARHPRARRHGPRERVRAVDRRRGSGRARRGRDGVRGLSRNVRHHAAVRPRDSGGRHARGRHAGRAARQCVLAAALRWRSRGARQDDSRAEHAGDDRRRPARRVLQRHRSLAGADVRTGCGRGARLRHTRDRAAAAGRHDRAGDAGAAACDDGGVRQRQRRRKIQIDSMYDDETSGYATTFELLASAVG